MTKVAEEVESLTETIRERIRTETKPEMLQWTILLERIRRGKCTPFIGAGAPACSESLPVASKIARGWADEWDYPFSDRGNLMRVAQFVAVQAGETPYVKERLLKELLEGKEPPNFDDPQEPHGLLAELPLPVYITTNYDDFMVRALQAKGKDPIRELCRWNTPSRRAASVFAQDRNFSPTIQRPVVFHLHGHNEIPESLVLTEDDYLDFLVKWKTDDQDLVPPQIQYAFAGTSLLFMGYAIADWNFRVLHRSLVGFMTRSAKYSHLSVQLAPMAADQSAALRHSAEKYLEQYFELDKIHVVWSDCGEFAAELRIRWEESES